MRANGAEHPQDSVAGAGEQAAAPARAGSAPASAAAPASDRKGVELSGPILQATGLTKRYGGLFANSDIDFTVNHGELRGIIGPNGAGKSTFFKMLTCEIHPTSGKIVFEGRDITGMNVTDVCQLGLTKSYQVNQLFTGLTVRENLTDRRARRTARQVPLDLFRSLDSIPGSDRTGRAHAGAGQPDRRGRHAGVRARLWREAAA